MAEEIVRTLVTELKLSAASWNNDIKAAQKEAKAFTNEWKASLGVMKDVGVGMAAVGTAVAGSMLVATKSAVDFADNLNDLRQKTGVSVENLSKLGFAAEQSGSSLDGVSTGLKFLSKNMEAAVSGGKQQTAAFNALGISSKDLKAASGDVNGVFLLLADRFKSLPDGAEKSALAMQVFGKSGVDLIPVLNEGSAGIKAMGDQASATGNVITQDFATASDHLNDTISALEASVGGVSVQIATALLPVIQQMVDLLIPAIQWVSEFISQHQTLTLAVAAAAAGMAVLGTALAAIGAVVPSLIAGAALIGTALEGAGIAIAGVTAGTAFLIPAVGLVIGGLIDWAIQGTKLEQWLDGFIDGTLKTLGFQWDSTSEAEKSAAFTAAAVKKAHEEGLPPLQATTEAVKTHSFAVVDEAAALKKSEEASKAAEEAHKSMPVTLNAIPIGRFKDDIDRLTATMHDLRDGTDTAHDKWKDFRELLGQPFPVPYIGAFINILEDVPIPDFTQEVYDATQAQRDFNSVMGVAPEIIVTVGDDALTAAGKYDTLSEASKNNAKALEQATKDVKESAGHIFDDMFLKGESVFQSLGNALKGGALSIGRSIFEDVVGAIGGPIKKAFDDFFTGLIEGTGIKKFLSDLGSKIGGVLTGSFDASKVVTGGAGSVAGGAGSAGGIAGGAGSTVAAVSAVANVASAISGIIGNFQNAQMEGTLNAIEFNTRATYIEIAAMMDVHLSHIWFDLDNYLPQIRDGIAYVNMAIDQTNGILAHFSTGGGGGGSNSSTTTTTSGGGGSTTTTSTGSGTTSSGSGTTGLPDTTSTTGSNMGPINDPGAPYRDALGQWRYFNFTLQSQGFRLDIRDLKNALTPFEALSTYNADLVLDAFKGGTNYVPQTGLYQLHQGESVITADENGDRWDEICALLRIIAAKDLSIDGEMLARNQIPHINNLTRNERMQLIGAR